jgi:hypothetical protein
LALQSLGYFRQRTISLWVPALAKLMIAALQMLTGANFRFWHLADIDADAEQVRSWGEADIPHLRSNVS